MRIFSPTAFFMRLLSETFIDVRDFFVMFLVIITAFANIIYILNMQRSSKEESALYDDNLSTSIGNAWLG